jgi:programmed cell death 6-interacting protein
MVELLSIPLKKGSDLDLVKPLKTLIASTFSTADKPENYADALSELQRLRQLSVRQVQYRSHKEVPVPFCMTG